MRRRQRSADTIAIVLSLVTSVLTQTCPGDWLVRPVTEAVAVERSSDGKEVALCNGLILLGRQNIFDGTWWKTPSMVGLPNNTSSTASIMLRFP